MNQRQAYRQCAFLPCVFLYATLSWAFTDEPILGEAVLLPIHAALAEMGLSPDDLAFEKDIGEPVWTFRHIRDLLHTPLAMPGEADRILAALGNTEAEWSLWHRWMEVEPASNVIRRSSYAVEIPSTWPADRQRDLQHFLDAVSLASAYLEQAFLDLTVDDRSYAAASVLMTGLHPDLNPEHRRMLQASGVMEKHVDELLRERDALDPAPAAKRLLEAVQAVDMTSLLVAGRVFSDAVFQLKNSAIHWSGWPESPQALDTPWGQVIIGSHHHNIYDQPALLILDPGGKDQYLGGAGSANGLRDHYLSAIIDLQGDDLYGGEHLIATGTALFGISVICDADGRDHWITEGIGQGSGLFGVSLVYSMGMDDKVYRAGFLSQGAAYCGLGILKTAGGNNIYDIGLAGQGYAGVRGIGVLEDGNGHDVYRAGGRELDHERNPERFLSLAQGFSIGHRPFAGGGYGVLVDRKGNDHYLADIYGQGVSYWYSLGMLLDLDGHDTYSVHQYGQGTGIHLSHGLLYDAAGDDKYSGYILAQGSAHDYAIGILIDGGGDDTYTADHHAQGRAINNSFAMLLDRAGNDAYFARQPDEAQGVGNMGGMREYASAALLLDMGGTDLYSSGAENDQTLVRPDIGLIYDVESASESASTGRDEPMVNLDHMDLEQLFVIMQRYGNTPERRTEKAAARRAFFSRTSKAFAFLMDHIHLENIWIRLSAQEMVTQMAPDDALAILAPYLQEHHPDMTRRSAAFFMGLIPRELIPADDPLVLTLRGLSADYEAGGAAVRTLGKWAIQEAWPEILHMMDDPRERRRIVAINAAHDAQLHVALPALERRLDDPLFTVRHAALRARERLKDSK